MLVTAADLVRNPRNLKPHVVILGAGASAAAFPNGDANGRKSPTMPDLVEVLELGDLLDATGEPLHGQGFEALYSGLVERGDDTELVHEIESRVSTYFRQLELPDEPTLYDQLLLCTRNKDVIATFNWDPFLIDAYVRCSRLAPMPSVYHLHGNVRVGHCPDHPTPGEIGGPCPECGAARVPSRLLYPVRQKNYSEDPFIAKQWESVRYFIEHSFCLTVFGYGAPDTDVDAMDLMAAAWTARGERIFETTETIDLKAEEHLRETWGPFIYSHHWRCRERFDDSFLNRWPRRTCEALWASTVEGGFVEPNPFPAERNFDGLAEWIQPFLDAEAELESSGSG